jgi:hypothetical protein
LRHFEQRGGGVTERPLEHNPWWVGTLCLLALAATWICFTAVFHVLPAHTPGGHWALFFLALGSTSGLILTFERSLSPWAERRRDAARGEPLEETV